jgi:hypothetical protein
LGQRLDNLSWILANAGYCVEPPGRPYLTQQDIEAVDLRSEVQRVSEELGGVLDGFPVNVGCWDLRVIASPSNSTRNAISTGTALALVSIWDDVAVNVVNARVHRLLLSRSLDAVPGLVALIEERSGVNLLPSA